MKFLWLVVGRENRVVSVSIYNSLLTNSLLVLDVDTPNKKVATPTLSISLTPPLPSPAVQTPLETTPTPDYAVALATDNSSDIATLYNIKTPLTAPFPKASTAGPSKLVTTPTSLKSPVATKSVTMATTSASPSSVPVQSSSFSAEVIQSLLSNPSGVHPLTLQRNVIEERQRLLQQMQETTPTLPTPAVQSVAKQPVNRLKLSVSCN